MFDCNALFQAHCHRVLIVLADINYRQLPYTGKIHRLVHDALVSRAVAEKTYHDFVRAADFRSERRAGRGRNRAADGAGIAEETEAHIAHVHLAAAALGITVGASHALAEKRVQIGALGDQMTRAAMIAGNSVGTLERRTHPHRDGLLTAIRMGTAEHRFPLVELFEFLLLSLWRVF